MAAIDIDVRADIAEATKYLRNYERRVIPRATNRALNDTIRNVKTQTHRRLAKRTGLKIKEINENSRLTLSSFITLTARLTARRRSFNLRRFVAPSKLAVGAFKKRVGVVSRPWRKRRMFEGAFIMRGRTHGKLIVAARTSDNRYPIKGLYGPALHVEFNRPSMRRFMNVLAKKKFPVNFARNLKFYTSRL